MSKVELYEGCHGLTRCGEVVGPFEHRRAYYPFKTLVNGSSEVFMKNGRFYSYDRKSEYDIIAVADTASELMAHSIALFGKVETPHYEISTRANVNAGEPLFEVKRVDLKLFDRLLRLIEDETPAPTGDLQRLQVGCYGLTRGGEVVGPFEPFVLRTGNNRYKFQVTVGVNKYPSIYCNNGFYYADGRESEYDIIAVFPSKEAAEASRRTAPENESAAEIPASEKAEGGQSDSAPRLDSALPLDLKTGQWVKLHNGYILGPITVHSGNIVSIRGVGRFPKSLTPIEVLTILRDDIAAVVEQPA